MTGDRRRRAAEALLGLGEERLVLASGSARRRALLTALGLRFEVRSIDVDEAVGPGVDPGAEAVRLAEEKARAAARPGEDAIVLAADTLVALDGEALGKPRDDADAARMLRLLSGRAHDVVTGVAVLRTRDGRLRSGVERTEVRFAPLDEGALAALLDGETWHDKAGAYAVQGLAGVVVESLRGDYYNVVGLPLALVRRLLHALRASGDGAPRAASGEVR